MKMVNFKLFKTSLGKHISYCHCDFSLFHSVKAPSDFKHLRLLYVLLI